MISREGKKYLTDIKMAIISIDEHLEGKRNFDEYQKNKTKRRAVEREFEIIGEATSKVLKIHPEVSLSYSRLIVDLRNKVIHAYDAVDHEIIWKIVMKDLPVLLSEIEKLLTE